MINDIGCISDELWSGLVADIHLVFVEGNPGCKLAFAVFVGNDVCAAVLIDGCDGRERVSEIDADDC